MSGTVYERLQNKQIESARKQVIRFLSHNSLMGAYHNGEEAQHTGLGSITTRYADSIEKGAPKTDLMKQLKRNKRLVVLTVNGKAAAIVQDAEAYQRLLETAARASPEEGIHQGLEDAKQGKVRPVREVFDQFERKNGIPRGCP